MVEALYTAHARLFAYTLFETIGACAICYAPYTAGVLSVCNAGRAGKIVSFCRS